MYRKAIALRPDFAEACNNLGGALREQGRLDEAEASYRLALERKSDHPETRLNLAMVLLLRGEFPRGFEEYEWRWKIASRLSRPKQYRQPLWDGSSLDGRTILVWGEQGVGDEIMFASLIPEVVAAGGRCVVECDRRLVPLFARSFPHSELVPKSKPPDSRIASPDIDVQIPMGSLARWLRPDLESFNPPKAYLRPDAGRMEECRRRYKSRDETLIVGISWRSGSKEFKKSRTAPLDLWDGVLTQPGVQFVNLQYGDCAGDLAAVRERLQVDVYDDEAVDSLKSLDDFAAQVAAVDLVISIDNTTVHMAGALGVPVWTLLPFVPDWRWLLHREDSLWYPPMTLFRQSSRGDWEPVFEAVGRALASRIKHVSTQDPQVARN